MAGKLGSCTIEEQKQFQVKCASCRSTINKDKVGIKCDMCSKYYHSKCASITMKTFKKLASWHCDHCIHDILPFAKLDSEQLKLTMQGKDIKFGDNITLSPSFTTQSLLDKIPGFSNFSEDDFLSDTISSKYYTPSEFLENKFRKDRFSMIHINIASLSLHIDDLKSLLKLLDHPWDIVAISETKIREGYEPLINVSIDGYDFIQTSTKSFWGGSWYVYKKRI